MQGDVNPSPPESEIKEGVHQEPEATAFDAPVHILSDRELNEPIDVAEVEDALLNDNSCSRFAERIPGYQPLSVLGRGGQGVVLRALHHATGRTVAIKVLDGGRFASEHAASRFNREAALLASVNHPNIVGILDRGVTADGAAYLVMPLIRGTSLADYYTSQSPTHQELAALFAEIAGAVGVLHGLKICHRDLKPTNVRIDPKGHPKILDFGLALDYGAASHTVLTETGQILGSIAWTSPEQARGEAVRVGPPSDVYSLGVMLYFAVHKRPPYPTDGPLHEVVRRICKSNPKIGFVGPMADVIARCLAKKPSDRYATASELALDLERVASGTRPRTRRRVRGRAILFVTVFLAVNSALAAVWLHVSSGQGKEKVTIVSLPQRENTISMRMIEIPAGSCLVGSAPSETGHRRDELQRLATFSRPFWTSSTAVTRGQFALVMGLPPEAPADSDLPAAEVSWDEAKAFCAALSHREGRHYRLPTEDEWEYSCRASMTVSPYALRELEDVAWFEANSDGVPHPVGRKSPNRWGLFDPEGNVWQWCEGTDSHLPLATTDRVVRGGSYASAATQCRCASRRILPAKSKSPVVGFRVVSD